jgi:hypothetical protein
MPFNIPESVAVAISHKFYSCIAGNHCSQIQLTRANHPWFVYQSQQHIICTNVNVHYQHQCAYKHYILIHHGLTVNVHMMMSLFRGFLVAEYD